MQLSRRNVYREGRKGFDSSADSTQTGQKSGKTHLLFVEIM